MAKSGIHPRYYPDALVTCSCGNTFRTGATVPEIRTDICSNCHPFYTGEQRIVDTAGQVDRFMKRLEAAQEIRSVPKSEKKTRRPIIETIEE
jgi:large subunit ribosomal protein L31